MPLIYGEGWKKALDRLQRKIQKSLNLASLVSTDAPWIMPFERNPRFTGRGPQLAQLEEKLFARDYTTKIAIMGLGGVGKTQLVLELLFRTKEKHQNCAIIWIRQPNTESLHQAYLDVAQRLGIQGWNEQNADVKALMQKYLTEDIAGQWLLVFS
jgi:Cdc6-like AAA superfamily ATPase